MEWLTDQDYETAAKNGISRQNVYNRFYTCGWTREKTITKPVKKTNLWGQWGDEAVVSKVTFYERVKAGWEPKKAATTPRTPPNECRKHAATLTAEQIQTAVENGIKRSTVKQRVYQYGWSVEDAITAPVGTKLKTKNPFNPWVGIRRKKNEH